MNNILEALKELSTISIPLDGNIVISLLGFLAALLALVMLFSKQALTVAISLLGILLCSAGIYAMLGEHFIAAIQLVVYAGAIMVLFIFSIMLLNFKREEERDFKLLSFPFALGVLAASSSFFLVVYGLYNSLINGTTNMQQGLYTQDYIHKMGGNTIVLAQELYTSHALLFEIVSLALLIGLIAAVVLAKRKID